MKNLKSDLPMLYFLITVLILLIIGAIFGENFESLINFWLAIMFVCVVGISSFFFMKKSNVFRNNFIASYFTVVVFLLGFNVQDVIFGTYDNIIVKMIIIGTLAYLFAYPFLKKDKVIEG